MYLAFSFLNKVWISSDIFLYHKAVSYTHLQVSVAALTPFVDVAAALTPVSPFTEVQARQILDVMVASGQPLSIPWVRYAYPSDSASISAEETESGESVLLSSWLPPAPDEKKPADKSSQGGKSGTLAVSAEASYLLILKDFLDEKPGSGMVQNYSYEKLLTLTEPSNYVMPSKVLMDSLKKAARAGNLGQVVLAGLQALDGQKADKIHPSVMVQVLKAFESVGLSEETTSLAREVLAGLTRKKEN